MNENWRVLCNAVPREPDWKTNWDILMYSNLALYLNRMAETLQAPFWHGEGDVLTHTKMVCEQLAQDMSFRCLPEGRREILFAAALMHDIGKISCTRMEDGVWTSPNHTIVGSKMAREILWKDFALAGTKEEQNIRECICNLIRYHSVPVHIAEQKQPELRLHEIAAQGELVPDFSLEMLSILVKADLKGRICDTISASADAADLCFSLAEEEGLMDGPAHFPSDVTEYAYLSGRNVWKEQPLYDDTWGEVILMSGLPGTGKDTWIQAHYPELPMISLDQIRNETHVSPAHNQGRVIQEARERAKKLLRKHSPFVWNATNLSPMIRGKQISLFEQYHARVRIVFLETSWEKNLERNSSRPDAVPEQVIGRMLKNLEIPERREARTVEW
ncbi:MAG: AAA family ATPase [Clostridiales bacterium]|nr:AAA family ATPase [Clostridiales bacterium]